MIGTSVMKELKDGANVKLLNPLMNNVEKWTNVFILPENTRNPLVFLGFQRVYNGKIE